VTAWYDRYITTKHGVQGGAPIIRGTRTPVRSVIELLRIHDNDVGEVRRALAYLDPAEIDAAIAYYNDNPTVVDADIRRQQEALKQFHARA